MKKYLSLLLLISFTSYAVEVTPIKKGETALHTGYLISPETEVFFRQLNEENDRNKQAIGLYKNLIVQQEDSFRLMDQRLKNLQEQNNNLIDQQVKMDGTFSKISMFLIGAAAAILITYGLNRTN